MKLCKKVMIDVYRRYLWKNYINDYKKKLVDLSDIRINLKGKK